MPATQNSLAFYEKFSTLLWFAAQFMAARRQTSGARRVKTNPRATFKLFGQAPMSTHILSRNPGGFWIQGGALAQFLGSCDYSGVQVDVCFVAADKVEWYKRPQQASK